jgi:hypothetical protein
MQPSGGLMMVDTLPFRMWSPKQQAVLDQHQANMVGGMTGSKKMLKVCFSA